MKKKVTLIILLASLMVLVLSVTSASAATRKISLWHARVDESGGSPVFTFRVWGEFDDFSGWVKFNGRNYDLNCHLQENDEILLCRGGTRKMVDNFVQVVVNGFSHYSLVESYNKSFCAPYYDWGAAEIGPWEKYGVHCTSEKPDPKELVEINNPFWGPSLYFYGEGGFCGPGGSWNDYGFAYYYIFCEELL